jgi:putative ribosome biogenesis GTPase RsgA
MSKQPQTQVVQQPARPSSSASSSTPRSPTPPSLASAWVCVQHHSAGMAAIIQGLFPRKTLLQRKRASKDVDFQVIAANIEMLLVIQSCQFDFNVRRLERYLVVVNEARIAPMILLSKTDRRHLQHLADRRPELRLGLRGVRVGVR